MLLAICVSLEMDISFSSDRLKMSSLLSSFAVAFSSGASAVAVVVAVPSSAPFAALALDERVRGVRCDISVLLSRPRPFVRACRSFVLLSLRLKMCRVVCCQVIRSEEHTSELQSRQYLVC